MTAVVSRREHRRCRSIATDRRWTRPRNLFLDWLPAADVLEEIVLSPYAEALYEQRAREAIAAADPTLADRVILSELNPRRYAAGF